MMHAHNIDMRSENTQSVHPMAPYKVLLYNTNHSVVKQNL